MSTRKSAPKRRAVRKPTVPPPPPIAAVRKVGRPQYEATEKDRRTVRAMVAYGIDQDAIAGVLAISERTLRRHFRHEINAAAAEANAKMAESLYNQGLGFPGRLAGNGLPAMPPREPNVAATIFWLKCRARWSERILVEEVPAEEYRDPSTMTDTEVASEIALLRRIEAADNARKAKRLARIAS